MQKKFLTNLALILLLNLLVKPFYVLGIDAEILKQVEAGSPGSYGEYFSLLGLSFILNIFLDIGITNFNTRNIAQNKQLLQKHFSGIITLRGLLAVGYIGLVLICGFFFGYSKHQLYLLSILAVNQSLVAFILYFRSNLSGLLLFKQDSFISVLDRILLIIICSVLLWGGVTDQPFQIEWFIYAQTFAYGTAALTAGLLVVRQTGKLKLKMEKAFSYMILKNSLPYALLILLMTIAYRADSVMLERMLPDGARQAAIYAQGFRFFEAFTMIGYLFAGLLLPIFARMLKEKQKTDDMVYLSLKIILSGAITVGIAAFVFSENIVEWRFGVSGVELTNSTLSFSMLMLCFISTSVTYIFGTLLTANGSMTALNWMAGVSLVANIVLNLFFIPRWGAYGAALASLITQGLTALFQVALSFKIISIQFRLKDFIQIFVFTGIIILLCFAVEPLSIEWPLKFALILGLGGIGALLSGMVNPKGLIKILGEKQ